MNVENFITKDTGFYQTISKYNNKGQANIEFQKLYVPIATEKKKK